MDIMSKVNNVVEENIFVRYIVILSGMIISRCIARVWMMSMLNFGENTLQVVCSLSHTDGQVSQDTGTIVMSTSTRLIFITKLTAEKRKLLIM